MSEFNLATGSVLFKGDMSQFEEDLKVGKAKLADLNKSLMTGGFKFQLYAAKAFNDELAKANKQAKRMMDEVKYGKGGLWMKEFSEKFKAGFDKFQSVAKGVAVGGLAVGGAALTAGAGGSPLAASTLEGSWKLLMTEIGGTFTPLVKDVSKGLQDIRNTWRGFSDETKKLINEGAKLIGIAGLAAAGLAAVSKGLTLIANHPFVAMLTGGISLGFMSKSWSAEKDDSFVGRSQRRSQSLTSKDIAYDSRTRQLDKLSPRAALLGAEHDFKKAWVEYEKDRTAYEEYRQGFAGGNIKGGLKRLADSTFTFGAIGEKLMQDAAASQNEFERAKLRYAKHGGKLPERKTTGGTDMLLGAASSPSMLGVQELFKTFQMAGMGTSQLEAEQKRVEQENQLKMLQNSDETVKVLKDIKQQGIKLSF